MHLIRKYSADTSGATAIEYGLIAALVAAAIILGATAIGTSVDAAFFSFDTKVKATPDP